MGQNNKYSWDDRKQASNLIAHGYDFSDIEDVFDGRFLLKVEDKRKDYGELRYNALVEYKQRIINVTFTPRAGKFHLISVRPAGREERRVYRGQNPQR